jgi:D-alanyl-D-alanine dipeptidase
MSILLVPLPKGSGFSWLVAAFVFVIVCDLAYQTGEHVVYNMFYETIIPLRLIKYCYTMKQFLWGISLLVCWAFAPYPHRVSASGPRDAHNGCLPGGTVADSIPRRAAKRAVRKKAAKKPARKMDLRDTQSKGAVAPVGPGTIDENFSVVTVLDPTIRLDIRYATRNNFTKEQIYDCPQCLLRPEAAVALVKAHHALQQKGYGLKMFDCYRPRPYQQRLWDKVPNPDYVTPPDKGSMHSRGAAVDLTIVDLQGNELDMGTPYDFFGVKAHADCKDLPANVLENRRLLRETLEAFGFKGIRTEWWHFSYQAKQFPFSDYLWPCK